MRKTLIIGATSAIAQATARCFAAEGDALFLVARNADKLAATANDLMTRGAASINTETLDVLDYDRHKVVVDAAVEKLGGLDVVLIAHGSLPDQKDCEQSAGNTRKEFAVNALSTISLLTYLANYFEENGQGTIAVISSVAGDRGRQSNYIYGSAKGAVTIFLQGLRNRMHKSGVHVITVKPGFVDTPMTAAFDKGFIWADPDQIAARIISAIKNKYDEVYAPWYWRVIMQVIRAIPERVFKRLNL
jgi:decaprenylphospho-beta-D-erythro-pentofuranosid-2-ulose 2-reductase